MMSWQLEVPGHQQPWSNGAYLTILLLHGVGVRGRCLLTLPPAPWCRGQRSVPSYPSSCSMVSGSEVGAYLPFLLLHGVGVKGRRLLTLPLAPWCRGQRSAPTYPSSCSMASGSEVKVGLVCFNNVTYAWKMSAFTFSSRSEKITEQNINKDCHH